MKVCRSVPAHSGVPENESNQFGSVSNETKPNRGRCNESKPNVKAQEVRGIDFFTIPTIGPRVQ